MKTNTMFAQVRVRRVHEGEGRHEEAEQAHGVEAAQEQDVGAHREARERLPEAQRRAQGGGLRAHQVRVQRGEAGRREGGHEEQVCDLINL